MKSKCCNATMHVENGHDTDSGYPVTQWMVCDKCGQPCDTQNKKSESEKFADSIIDDPNKSIAWAKGEIKAYQELIKILEDRKNDRQSSARDL
jgi:hypothetical protein